MDRYDFLARSASAYQHTEANSHTKTHFLASPQHIQRKHYCTKGRQSREPSTNGVPYLNLLVYRKAHCVPALLCAANSAPMTDCAPSLHEGGRGMIYAIWKSST